MPSHIAASGRLGGLPKLSSTKANKPLAFASMAVTLNKRSNVADDGEYTWWLSLVAFGKQAEILGVHEKGDLISIAGNLQVNEYENVKGELATQFQVVIDSLVSARSVSTKRKPTSIEEAFHQAERDHGSA